MRADIIAITIPLFVDLLQRRPSSAASSKKKSKSGRKTSEKAEDDKSKKKNMERRGSKVCSPNTQTPIRGGELSSAH